MLIAVLSPWAANPRGDRVPAVVLRHSPESYVDRTAQPATTMPGKVDAVMCHCDVTPKQLEDIEADPEIEILWKDEDKDVKDNAKRGRVMAKLKPLGPNLSLADSNEKLSIATAMVLQLQPVKDPLEVEVTK